MPKIELKEQSNNPKYIVAMGPRARSRIKRCCQSWRSGLRAECHKSPPTDLNMYPELVYSINCICCGCSSGNHPTFDLAVQAWDERVTFLEVLEKL